MVKKTHIAAGLIASQLVIMNYGITDPQQQALMYAVGGAAALLADIDMPRSAAGRKIPVSYAISVFFRHRTVTHSATFLLVLLILLPRLFPGVPPTVIYAGLAGYASHLVVDLLNPEGVMIAWPLNFWLRIPVITFNAGGIIEKLLFFPALIFLFLVLINK